MSRFDLSNAADFSRVTQQSIGQVGALIDGRDPSQWDILEGSYNGVVFHVFRSKQEWSGALGRITDSTGRRKVKYQFPYRDGQTTDDMGRKAGSFQMDIVIHGIRYLKGLAAIIREFNKPTPGVLVHPVRGEITVAVEDVEMIHSSEQRKAVALSVTFIEHNFTIGDIRELEDNSVRSKLSQALDIFAKIDDGIRRVEQTQLFVQAVKNRIGELLEIFKRDNSAALTAMNVAFNSAGANTIPTLLPVNQGGTRNANGTTSDSNFVTVRSVSDPFNSVPVVASETVQALAVIEIRKQLEQLRDQAAAIITDIENSGGSLEFFDDIQNIRESVVLQQSVFEAGVASSNARIIDYNVPRIMSVREAAFENGIDLERVYEIEILNPELGSVNMIPPGTILKLPVG